MPAANIVNAVPAGETDVAVAVGVMVSGTCVAVRVAVGVPTATIAIGSSPIVTGAPESSRNDGDANVMV